MKAKVIALIVIIAVIVVTINYLEGQKTDLPPIEPVDDIPLTVTGGTDTANKDLQNTVSEEELQRIAEKAAKYLLAPELVGIVGYLNADEGIKIADFRGQVVLVDFWTYTCINCIRTLPHLNDWQDKYGDQGLTIIGVHTPEFEFEKKYQNVRNAMDKYDIEYRVVQDNDYLTWRAYKNRFWPRKYLVDADGFIRYDHIGEGRYAETEEWIQKLLDEMGHDVSTMQIGGIEDQTPDLVLRTPELYAGHTFVEAHDQELGNDGGLRANKSFVYQLPETIDKDKVHLEGNWYSASGGLEAKEDRASIVLDYLGKSVNIVVELGSPVRMVILEDEEYITADRAGEDVTIKDGKAYILMEHSRLYNLVKGEHERHTLRLEVDEGFSFNAFTFG